MTPIHPLPVIPVLDLSHGQVVRAVRGERTAYRPVESALVAGSAPCAVAAALLARVARPGLPAPPLYVADLDALQGGRPQAEVLRALLHAWPGPELWIDAGFGDAAAADALAAAVAAEGAPGADDAGRTAGAAAPADAGRLRFVFGSETLASRAALAEVAARPGAILSLDTRHAAPLDPAGCWEAPALWPATVIVMTLDRVGSGTGPDLATFARLRARAPDRRWIGAGGVRTAADLHAAAAAGAAGWLVASALHDGTLVGG
jgi:phosphoribosylformimino-5-aminoimidazole carboxamide ribotide isomerase